MAAAIILTTLATVVSAGCAYINHRIGQYLHAAPLSIGSADIAFALHDQAWFSGQSRLGLGAPGLSATGSIAYRSTPLLAALGLKYGNTRLWPVYAAADIEILPTGALVSTTYVAKTRPLTLVAQVALAGNTTHIHATVPAGHLSLPMLRMEIGAIKARASAPLFGSAPTGFSGTLRIASGALAFAGRIDRQMGSVRLTAPHAVAQDIAMALLIEQQRKSGKSLSAKAASQLAAGRVQALVQLGYVTTEDELVSTTIAWHPEGITVQGAALPTSLSVNFVR
ncbi:MAG: hypothetical protein GKR94_13320 [Gammaproteobacteria bacterium]|nr:hypothetical protein [Gammaproteobacteria bacterium]